MDSVGMCNSFHSEQVYPQCQWFLNLLTNVCQSCPRVHRIMSDNQRLHMYNLWSWRDFPAQLVPVCLHYPGTTGNQWSVYDHIRQNAQIWVRKAALLMVSKYRELLQTILCYVTPSIIIMSNYKTMTI